MLKPAVQLARPHQWVKNLLVFAPLFFTELVTSADSWLRAAMAFVAFCCAASAVYVLNDIVDREEDRLHPKKRLRPIASGAMPVPAALAMLAVLVVAATAASLWLGRVHTMRDVPFLLWPAAYLALNLLYSFWWKRIVVVDCICIAIGFQLRVHAGAAAIDVETSRWLLLCTFFFSLFLAFCKRYEEVGRQGEASGRTRATMKDYTQEFLSTLIGPLAALSILSYALYTVSPETIARHRTDALMFTVPVVTYGVFRYLFLVYRRSEGGDPARLLFRDPPLVVSGIVYLGLVLALLHGH